MNKILVRQDFFLCGLSHFKLLQYCPTSVVTYRAERQSSVSLNLILQLCAALHNLSK